MAFDLYPFGINELSLDVSGAPVIVSVGIFLASGFSEQYGAVGVSITIENTAIAGDTDFDIVVQTADQDAGNTDSPSWIDTNSRLNGVVVAAGATKAFSIVITDPVLDKVRLKFIPNVPAVTTTAVITWLADRVALTLNS